MGAELLKLLLLYVFIRGTLCIPLNQFYPFGPDVREATTKLAKGDDVFSQRVFTEGVIQFFGQLRESVIVSCITIAVLHVISISVPHCWGINVAMYIHVLAKCTY